MAFPLWLDDSSALQTLQERADRAAQGITETGLADRLAREVEASRQGGIKVFRIGNSLRRLSEELAVLAVAHWLGAQIAAEVWETTRRDYLPALLALDEINFQGRNHTPPWNADLWTADIGMNLAVAMHFNCPAIDADEIEAFLQEKCLAPIMADWVDNRTRVHSLDSMGHNWWSVIVGGAGVMAAVLGDRSAAERIANSLRAWATFAGNALSRKRSNFGWEGDYVEGVNYGQYALVNPCAFAYFYPDLHLVPDLLDDAQAHGLADWLKASFLPTPHGYHPQRFGDVGLHPSPRAEIWHSLARLLDDQHLLDLAHQIKSKPHAAMELLLWQPRPTKLPTPSPALPLRCYPTSGLALLHRGGQRVSVRAGEAWNHNHFDAGSFIYHEDDIVWIDDGGTCTYSRPEYRDHYVTPAAHNVAYAPELVPPINRAIHEGLPLVGRYLCHVADGDLSILCADTGVLCGGMLLRSYRWFFHLAGEVLIVWDDLAAHHEQRFEHRIHTNCDVDQTRDDHVVLHHAGRRCSAYTYSDLPVEASVQPALMGQLKTGEDLEGRCLAWRTSLALRVKFGMAMGVKLRSAQWSTLDGEGGWQCEAGSETGTWWVWLNPLADGRIMHTNCIARWRGLETDAYALILRHCADCTTLWAVHSSFVRRCDTVLDASLTRQPLRTIKLDDPHGACIDRGDYV